MSSPRKFLVVLGMGAWFLMVLADKSSAQQPSGGRGGFGGGGFGFGGVSGLELLRNESVQKELELIDSQIEQIREVTTTSNVRDRIQKAFGELEGLSNEERRAKFGEIIAEFRAATQKEIDKILLPHQNERLRQIEFQVSLQRSGGVPGGDLADELNITDPQRDELRAAAEKAAEELREKIRQLQVEARDKVLGVLSPAQIAKYKELVGEPFDYQPDFGGRGRTPYGGNRGDGSDSDSGGDNGSDRGGGRRGARPAN